MNDDKRFDFTAMRSQFWPPRYDPRQVPNPPPPKPPRPKQRFRWDVWVLLPMLTLLIAFILGGLPAGISWAAIMAAIGIVNTIEFSALALLGLICTGIVTLVRLFRGTRSGDDDE